MSREIAGKDPVSLGIVEDVQAALEADQIRVKVDYAAPKHGTELHGFKNIPDEVPQYYDMDLKTFLAAERSEPAAPRLFRPGNMFVGHVTEVGADVSEFAPGDRVAGYGTLREVQTVKVNQPLIAGPGAINDIIKMDEDMSWKAALCYDRCTTRSWTSAL